jgi:predicted hotdog family 3-hydroxylacyl-ACP dehydratase
MGNELAGLLPHSGKMFLISRILEYDVEGRSLVSEYDVSGDCIFYDPALQGVPSWAAFEFMAQAVSALSGLTGKFYGRPPLLGFILSVSSLELGAPGGEPPLFLPGAVLRTEIREEVKMGQASTFLCVLSLLGETAARAKITVMDVEDISAFTGKEHHGT